MRYVTAEEMRKLDRNAIEKRGVPASILMENAGKAVAEEGMRIAAGKKAIVFSGYGNNGGDGFVAARHLMGSGYDVKVFLIGKPKNFSPESGSNNEKLIALGCVPVAISDEKDMDDAFCEIGEPNLVVDAIFGIGMKGKLDDFYKVLIDKINSLSSPVVSADVPSGLDSDSGMTLSVAVRASSTVTFGFPKIGFKNKDARPYLGKVVVADIGLGSE